MVTLKGLMSNVSGLCQVRLRLFVNAICFSVWCFDVASSYHAFSDDAVTVVAEILPIDLIAHKRYDAFVARKGRLPTVAEDGPSEIQTMAQLPASDLSSMRETTLTE